MATVELDPALDILGVVREKDLKEHAQTTEYAVLAAVMRNLSETHSWAATDKLLNVILGIRNNGIVDAILDRMPGLSLLGDYAWCICDSQKTVLLGIKWTGEVVIHPSAGEGLTTTRMPGMTILSDYAWCICDSQKTVLFGIKWSGEIVIHPSALSGLAPSGSTGFAWDEGRTGQRDVFVMVDGVPYQVTSSGDNTSANIQSGQVSYVERNGMTTGRTVPMPEAGTIADFVKAIIHVIFLGQSLACGINSGTPVTRQPPSANRVLTIKDGIQLSDEKGVLSSDMVVPFQPMVAKTKEPPCMQAAAEVNRSRCLPANAGLLISNHGRGAQGIQSLNKGTIPYENSLTAIREAKAECDRKGWPYSVPCISWNQGQHDGGMAEGVYYALLVQLQLDYKADIQAITGETGPLPMIITQMSNWTAPVYKRAFSNIPHEQYQVSLDFPDRFVVAGPQYWLPSNTDGIHLPADSYSRDGTALSGALGALIKGERWLPTACVEAVRSDTKVILRFNVPNGPLAIDTVNVSDPGFWGLRWVDSTDSATITAVQLTGFNTIEVTLSNVPTGAQPMIGVADIGIAGNRAGPTTGPRTCIRDSSPLLDCFGVPVYNWACHNLVPVTSI
ncbi:hypothetical protein WG29040_23170 [Pseudomonas sp. PAMC 29040]|uniref:hypothetical protein n=1 Tax=Pseudomonas sp. PAMC 29040 TaxID=2498450 RepID=UPI000F9A659E|nr:hypothetical protein [Pseudomonas sp. PAMC 29040]RUT30843.1 hypothetical protein WG29040_23170 [Pseudomonas sp. PAMC 29040]